MFKNQKPRTAADKFAEQISKLTTSTVPREIKRRAEARKRRLVRRSDDGPDDVAVDEAMLVVGHSDGGPVAITDEDAVEDGAGEAGTGFAEHMESFDDIPGLGAEDLSIWSGVVDELQRAEWDPTDYNVRFHGNVIGCIKPLHAGTPNEYVTAYCRRHGCKTPLRRTDQALPTADYVMWMQHGLDLPDGAAGREEHLHMFRNLELIRREHSGHDAGAG